jgi:hypothetical protein
MNISVAPGDVLCKADSTPDQVLIRDSIAALLILGRIPKRGFKVPRREENP